MLLTPEDEALTSARGLIQLSSPQKKADGEFVEHDHDDHLCEENWMDIYGFLLASLHQHPAETKISLPNQKGHLDRQWFEMSKESNFSSADCLSLALSLLWIFMWPPRACAFENPLWQKEQEYFTCPGPAWSSELHLISDWLGFWELNSIFVCKAKGKLQ